MKRRFLPVVVALIMAMIFVCGCGKSETISESKVIVEDESAGENSKEKIVLTMSYWNSKDTMSALLDYLTKEVPHVEIRYQFIENTNYDDIIDTQLAYGEAPDIICVSPGSALRYARGGYLKNVNELAQKYSDAGTSIYAYDGNVYALPGISWFEGIWYNKTLFEENEITLPKTFDEYIAVCKEFKELGIVPLAAGLESWEPMLKNSMAFVTAEYLSTEAGSGFGEAYREGKMTLDGTWNPYIEKWSEMISENIYTTEMLGVKHAEALEQFATGNAAMFCSGPWDYDAIININPNLQLDMMPFYGTQESSGWLIGGPGCGFAINEASKNIEAVMEVLTAISTYEGQAALWENNQGGSSYLIGTTFELPTVYEGVEETLAAGNVYCPWNEWGVAAGAHEAYGKEMKVYFIGVQDLSTTLQHVDMEVSNLYAE